jgi:hypothetical protein
MTLRRSTRIATSTRLLAVAGAAALAVGLAGCSGSSTPKPTTSASAKATEKPALTNVKTPAGGSGTYVGAQSDVTVTQCKLVSGKWSVTGTVKNPEKSTQGYRIYVSLLKGQTDTRAVQEVDVKSVAAGASTKWDTDIAVSDHGLSCVLRVERYSA